MQPFAGTFSAAVFALATVGCLAATTAMAEDLPTKDPSGAPYCCKTGRSGLSFTKELRHAPFPFTGKEPDGGSDFLGPADADGTRWRTLPSGARLAERGTYDDPRVLFHVPPQFDQKRPFRFLVYLQAPGATVGPAMRALRVMEQVDESKANVILVAPQMAKADDPAPGKFAEAGAFREFLAETAAVLRKEMGLPEETSFDTAPVILAAHRGGDTAAAWVLARGGATERIAGVILLAPLLEKADLIIEWARGCHRQAFLICLAASSEEVRVRGLVAALRAQGVPVLDNSPATTRPGSFTFVPVSTDPGQVPLLGPPEEPIYFFLR